MAGPDRRIAAIARVNIQADRHTMAPMSIAKTVVRVFFAATFVVAGVTHFTNREFFIAIVPPYLPWPVALVYVSGVAEVVLGVLLLIPRSAGLAGWGLIALLIAVFPANIHMAANPQLYPTTSPAALWIRLPIQGVLIAVAYWFAQPAITGKKMR
jgi:uncharacterized membrane protein